MNFYYRPSNKYKAKKTVIDGIEFASKHEAERYLFLKNLKVAGQITDLQLQKRFELIPNQYIDGKLIEHKVSYVADFTYISKVDGLHVEDAKGIKTPQYIIKRKLMLQLYGIRIEEV